MKNQIHGKQSPLQGTVPQGSQIGKDNLIKSLTHIHKHLSQCYFFTFTVMVSSHLLPKIYYGLLLLQYPSCKVQCHSQSYVSPCAYFLSQKEPGTPDFSIFLKNNNFGGSILTSLSEVTGFVEILLSLSATTDL